MCFGIGVFRAGQSRGLYVHPQLAPPTRATLFPGCSSLCADPNHYESFLCRFR